MPVEAVGETGANPCFTFAPFFGLPLRVLEALPRAFVAILLALFLAGVPGEEPRLPERRPQLRVMRQQCPRDPMPDGPRLPMHAAAGDVDADVDPPLCTGDDEVLF